MIPAICPGCRKAYQAASRTYAEDPERRCRDCITAWAETKPCPDCGEGPIKTQRKGSWFRYGTGSASIRLKCIESFRICQACDFVYLDYENEETHLMAINRYRTMTGQKPVEK